MLLLLLLGCGPQGPVKLAGRVTVPVEVCSTTDSPYFLETIDAVFSRDGDGPWRPVELLNGHGAIEVTDPEGRYGYAVATTLSTSGPDQRSTNLQYVTLAEAPSVRWCNSPGLAVSQAPNLTVRGLTPSEWVNVAFNSWNVTAEEVDGQAALYVQPGEGDLLVTEVRPEGSRVLVRRGQRIDENSPLILDLADAVVPVDVPVRVSGVEPGWTLSTSSGVQTEAGSFAHFGQWSGDPSQARVQVLPASMSSPTDKGLATFVAYGPGASWELVWLELPMPVVDAQVAFPRWVSTSVSRDAEGHPKLGWSSATTVFPQLSVSAAEARLAMFASPKWLGARQELCVGSTSEALLLDERLAAAATAGAAWYSTLESQDRACGQDAVWCLSARAGTL